MLAEGRASGERSQREDVLFDLEEARVDRDLERADVLLALLVGYLGRGRLRVAEETLVDGIANDAG